MESHLEARLWNDVFNLGQDYIGMRRGTIRGTVLIETIPAAFEMDEIIYELRDHSSGLNCGRWDYIFSVIKRFRQNPAFVLPDRSAVTMTAPFMDAYVRLLIKTCHRRGVHAMGGMAAQIPIKDDPEANEKAMSTVRADKLREVRAGHDGTWVAHPALAAIASDIFNKHMPTPNQLFLRREDVPRHRQRPAQHERSRRHHRRGHPQEPQHWPRVHGRLAARRRLRAHQLPYGRCGHGGSVTVATVAMVPPRREDKRGCDGHKRLRAEAVAGAGGRARKEGTQGK